MTEASEPQHQIHLEQTHLGEVPMLNKTGGNQKSGQIPSRPHTSFGPPKGSFFGREMGPLISGKNLGW